MCHENLRNREGFHRVSSYDDSSSEYAPLIGWHFCLILVLVCDWLKRWRNLGRWVADINYFQGQPYTKPLFLFHSTRTRHIKILILYWWLLSSRNWRSWPSSNRLLISWCSWPWRAKLHSKFAPQYDDQLQFLHVFQPTTRKFTFWPDLKWGRDPNENGCLNSAYHFSRSKERFTFHWRTQAC